MKSFNMKTISSAAAIALGLSLSACASGPSVENRSLNSVHQPVVERSNYAIDLALTSGGALPVQEQKQLSEWFGAMNLSYGDRISIDDASSSLAARSMIEAIASNYGLQVAGTAPVTAGQVAPGSIRVVVTRSQAYVPGCPDWATKYENNVRNATSSNFGCATNANMAAMIADPQDLVEGKDSGPNRDVSVGTKAVETLRNSAGSGAGGTLGGASSSSGGE